MSMRRYHVVLTSRCPTTLSHLVVTMAANRAFLRDHIRIRQGQGHQTSTSLTLLLDSDPTGSWSVISLYHFVLSRLSLSRPTLFFLKVEQSGPKGLKQNYAKKWSQMHSFSRLFRLLWRAKLLLILVGPSPSPVRRRLALIFVYLQHSGTLACLDLTNPTFPPIVHRTR